MDKPDRERDAKNRDPSRGEDSKRALSADEIFDCYPREITVLLGWFMTGHLTRLYKLFDGDMVLLIVLGEIAHHNISPFFAGNRLLRKGETIDWDLSYQQNALEPCNALSISDSTGIPRETCRRKVEKLCRCGLIERHAKGGYMIRRNLSEHFRDFNRDTFARWMAVEQELMKLISAARQRT